MHAGQLRSKIGFYKRVVPPPTGAEYGVPEGPFPSTPEFVCPANVRPRLGGEQVLADRLGGTNIVNVTVRQSSRTRRVDTSWCAKDERSGVIYNIRSVIDPYEGRPEHSMWLEMLCERGVAV